MNRERIIADMIAGPLEAMGYDLVRVLISGSARVTVQVMVERLDEDAVSVEDCAAVSREVSALLDVEDPIRQAYTLEVSSPGIDRPLVRKRDFERFAGFEARIETDRLVGGRKRFRGRLLGVTDEGLVRLAAQDGGEDEFAVPFEAIARAKLVLTDALIEASLKAGRRKAEDGGFDA